MYCRLLAYEKVDLCANPVRGLRRAKREVNSQLSLRPGDYIDAFRRNRRGKRNFTFFLLH